MFTDEQMEIYQQHLAGEFEQYGGPGADADWQPPRVANLSDFPLLKDLGTDDEYGDGSLLLVGFTDENLSDCECDESHITYFPIRADGMLGPIVTSGTFGETELAYNLDPIALMLGAEPEGEPLVPTWDSAREVTPDEWPAETISRESGTQTDMTDFEF